MRAKDPTAYGLVEVDHELRVKRFLEKPGANEVSTSLINAGIYILEPEILRMIPGDREVSIEREIFPELGTMGRPRAYVSSAYWRDIGTLVSYLAASHDILSGAIGRTEGFRYVSLHPSTKISRNVIMLPPLCMDEGCEIDAGATLGGRTSLGKGCAVGEDTVVEGSILFDGARVEDGAVVRDSIIGPGAVVGEDCVVRGHSVIGAGGVVEAGNILARGIRVSPGSHIPERILSF